MGQKRNKRISVQELTNPEEIAELVAKVADMSEALEQLVQEKTKANTEHEANFAAMSAIIEKLVLEGTDANTEHEANFAAMSAIIEKLVLEGTDEKAQMEREVFALQERTRELEQAAQTNSAANTEHEANFAAMSAIIEKLVLEGTDEEAQMEREVFALQERTRELEQAAQTNSAANTEHEANFAAMSAIIEKLVLEGTDEKAQMEREVIALQERTRELEQAAQTNSAANTEHEANFAAMSAIIEKLVLEGTDQEAQMEREVFALQERTRELEQAAQTNSAANTEHEANFAAMSAIIEKLVLEGTDQEAQMEREVFALQERTRELEQAAQTNSAANTEHEANFAAMSAIIEKLVLEGTDQEAQMEREVFALQERTRELEQAAQTNSAANTEHEANFAAMSAIIEKLVLEGTDQEAQMEREVFALQERTRELEQAAQTNSAANTEHEANFAAMSAIIEKLVLEGTDEKAQMEREVFALQERTRELEQAAQTNSAANTEHEANFAAMSAIIEKLVLEGTDQEAQMEREVFALQERTRELEQAAQTNSAANTEHEANFAAMSAIIEKLVLEGTDQEAQMEREVFALQERTRELEQAAQTNSAANTEHEANFAAMSAIIEKLVLEGTDQEAQMEREVFALQERTRELEQAAQTNSAANTEHEANFAAMSAIIEKLVLEGTDEKAQMEREVFALQERTRELEQAAQTNSAANTEHEANFAAMSAIIEKLVLEGTDQEAQMEREVFALQERTRELEQAAQTNSAANTEHEANFAAMSAIIEKLVLEGTDEKAQMEREVFALQERTRELEQAAQTNSAESMQFLGVLETMNLQFQELREEKEEFQERLAAMFVTVRDLVLGRTEVEAEFKKSLTALLKKTEECFLERTDASKELVDSLEAIHLNVRDMRAENMELEEKIATLSEAIGSPDLEKMEARAEYEEKLAAISETVEKLVQERNEESKELVDSLEAIHLNLLDMRAENLELEEKIATLSEAIGSPDLEKMEARAEYEEKLAAISETVEKLVQERNEENTQMDHKVVALETRTLALEQAAQTKPAESKEFPGKLEAIYSQVLDMREENMELEEKMATLSEAIGSPDLEKMEARAEYEEKLAAISETVEKLVQERNEESKELVDSLEAIHLNVLDMRAENMELEEKIATLSEAIGSPDLEKMEARAEYEEKLAAISETVEKLVQERNEAKAHMDCVLADLEERAIQHENKVKAEFEEKLAAISVTVDKCFLERTVVKAEFEEKLAAISKTVEECFLERTVTRFEQKPATMSETIDSLDLEKIEEPITLGPRTPGSRDPSSLQDNRSILSNSSDQLLSQLLQLAWAMKEESARKQPRSLPPEDNSGSAPSTPVMIISESPGSIVAPEAQSPGGRDIGNTELDGNDTELDGKQSEPTAALDSSEVLPPQAERGLHPLQQSLNAQPSAADVLADFDKQSLGPKPQPSLEDGFMLLDSDDWLLKVKGLDLIQGLAESRPEALIQKGQEVCRAVVREVMSHRWSVSMAALLTLTDLFTLLKRDLDPELDWVANALLRKTASDIKALRQIANFTLGRMIRSCSPLRCVEALLSGLRNLTKEDLEEEQTAQWDSEEEAAVRESIAEHLLILVQSVGAQPFLGLQQEMLERFLSAVCHLTQDASERVRSCAKKTLGILSAQQEASQILAQLQH